MSLIFILLKLNALGLTEVLGRHYVEVIRLREIDTVIQSGGWDAAKASGKVRLEGTGWLPSTLPFDSRGSVNLKDLAAGRRSPS